MSCKSTDTVVATLKWPAFTLSCTGSMTATNHCQSNSVRLCEYTVSLLATDSWGLASTMFPADSQHGCGRATKPRTLFYELFFIFKHLVTKKLATLLSPLAHRQTHTPQPLQFLTPTHLLAPLLLFPFISVCECSVGCMFHKSDKKHNKRRGFFFAGNPVFLTAGELCEEEACGAEWHPTNQVNSQVSSKETQRPALNITGLNTVSTFKEASNTREVTFFTGHKRVIAEG